MEHINSPVCFSACLDCVVSSSCLDLEEEEGLGPFLPMYEVPRFFNIVIIPKFIHSEYTLVLIPKSWVYFIQLEKHINHMKNTMLQKCCFNFAATWRLLL